MSEKDVMPSRKVTCPSCGARLGVPENIGDRLVRCGRCEHKFQPPRRLEVMTDAVVEWLSEDEAPGPDERPPEAARRPAASKEPSPSTAQVDLAKAADILMTRCDRAGALIEFPADLLNEVQFRAALPRRCLQCGTRTHLEAHVIIYSPALVDSVSLEAEHEAGKMVMSVDEVKNLTVEQLLERLPHVPNVPAPGNLPMPYWLCDMCSEAGAISGQIEVNAEGQGHCHLLIGNLWRAEEFLSAIGARRTHCYQELSRRIAETAEKPWDMLSLVVKNRIQQWFKPAGEEQFIAYVPDRDHTRTEDGMSGIIVSSTRLLFHHKMRHREVEGSQPVEMQLSMSKTKGVLGVRASNWDATLTVDGDGILNLRRALAKGKFRATWR